jgi:uncharacterized protein YjbI with pentapeptide repeats
MTKNEIAAMLADHLRWLCGEGGKRADLAGANLTGARLAGAILDRAILDGAKIKGATVKRLLRRTMRSDGYEFFLWHCQEGLFVAAGCRWFTMTEARQHWTTTRAGTPLGDETMDILDFFDATIKRMPDGRLREDRGS